MEFFKFGEGKELSLPVVLVVEIFDDILMVRPLDTMVSNWGDFDACSSFMAVELVAIDLSLCHLQCLCYNALFEHYEHQESESL